jgi:catechol 2,3-dioxygenase-like lactoylglutathione lyase family enzyme
MISRRALLALGPAMMLGQRALAEELKGDELPLVTTGLEHIGMVVPSVADATRFYSSVFNPDLQKEKDTPLRYYVMLGSGYIAIGSRPGVTESRIDHYCTLVRGYNRELMTKTLADKGITSGMRGVVPDPDGIGLQLIATPGGPGPTAVPGGRLVEVTPLVEPIGMDHIVLKVADVHRSSDFYRHFFKPAKGGFKAADTLIVLRPTAAGESAGVERISIRVKPFDRKKVLTGLTALGATLEKAGPAGVIRFRDPNGIGVELKTA